MEHKLQPIQTAPRDGTYILLFGPSGYTSTPLRCAVGHYDSEYRPSNPWQTHSNDAFTDGGGEPTHWMPLPETDDIPSPSPMQGNMTALESISEKIMRPYWRAKKWEYLVEEISKISHYFDCDGALDPGEWERKNDLAKRKSGVEVVIRQEKELLLDLDDLDAFDRAFEMTERLEAAGFIESIENWPSKSAKAGKFVTPRGYKLTHNKEHWRIKTRIAMTPDEATFFQTLLGSDPDRELLNFLGHKAGIQEPSKLYKYPERK